MKTKCKSTRKKGQSKYKLKGFRLTVCKAVRLSALSSPALHLSQSSLSRLLWGVPGEGLLMLLVCPLKTDEISGPPQGASAGSAFISVSTVASLHLSPPPDPSAPAALETDLHLPKSLQELHLPTPQGNCVWPTPGNRYSGLESQLCH